MKSMEESTIVSEHGGDVYRNKVDMDLSVNISPYGIPPKVRAAINAAVLDVEKYPDPLYEEARLAIAKAEGVSCDNIVCGNGASELIYAVARVIANIKNANGISHSTASILVPCYSEYKKAFIVAGYENVNQVFLDEQKKFIPDDECLEQLLDAGEHNKASAILLGNPNNPTGRVLPKDWLIELINRAEQRGVFVILDESFLALTVHEEEYAKLQSPNLIRIRAFTKSMAIPGVRFGYLISENADVIRGLRSLLPDWNVSGIAAKAGVAAAEAKEWLKERVFDKENGIKALTEFWSEKLSEKGFKVFDTDTNFLLVKCSLLAMTNANLYEATLRKGILIRDCSNFEGLGNDFYRIAVKSREDCQKLLDVIDRIIENSGLDYEGKVNFRTELLSVEPSEIEKTSFKILTSELEAKGIYLEGDTAPIIKRCIHTTADFEYAVTLSFSKDAVKKVKNLIREGACIVTDTNMALSGINKTELAKYGGQAFCFMADEEVARIAKERGSTRASVSMERAASLGKKVIFVVGNAPTALVTLCEMMDDGRYTPDFVIGVPVGFVNVEQAKNMIIEREINHIVNRGRKGGSNVAAAIVNAILYSMRDEVR